MPTKQRDKAPAETLPGLPQQASPPRAKAVLNDGHRKGRLVKLTEEIAYRVGERVGTGLKLERALALETQNITLAHWNAQLIKSPRMLRAFNLKVAEKQLERLERITDSAETGGKLPVGDCWILERAFPAEYGKSSTTKHEHSGSVLVGVAEGIRERSAAYAMGNVEEPRALRAGRTRKAQVIDVASVTIPTDKVTPADAKHTPPGPPPAQTASSDTQNQK